MQCANCSTDLREGELVCPSCGMSQSNNLSTRQIGLTEGRPINSWGTGQFGKGASLLIRIGEESIDCPIKDQITIGRIDPRTNGKPDVDLDSYQAQQKGVSRFHVMIRRSNGSLTIIDLGSANGTHLNGQLLAKDESYPLRDGDEVKLGLLVMHIYFK